MATPTPTPTRRRTVGACPVCGAEIADSDILIEYETGGCESAYAECPGCRDVVTPA